MLCCLTVGAGAVSVAQSVDTHATVSHDGTAQVTLTAKIHLDQVINGYKDALKEWGYEDVEKRIFIIPEYTNHCFNITLQIILKKFPEVTLIATESDNDVFYFWQIILDEYPEYSDKLRFIGLGHVGKLAENHHFATVDQHCSQLGAVAVEKIIGMIENGEPDHVLRETIPCELCNVITLSMK
jgi:DNA-binding LacI/PurR family transcriptional regulator